jgi:hypothetical protein
MCRSGFSANSEVARKMTDRKQPENNREMRILSAFIMLHLVGSEGLSMSGSSPKVNRKLKRDSEDSQAFDENGDIGDSEDVQGARSDM